MISVKQAKQVRELLGLTHIVIFGVTESNDNVVATHGKTVVQAKESAQYGNILKGAIGWPLQLCNSKPLERKCENCSYWQRGYHRPGDVISENKNGKCMFNPDPVTRFEKDRACGNFEPVI